MSRTDDPRTPPPGAPGLQDLSPEEHRRLRAGEAGPHSPGHPAPAPETGPETGGYDDHSPSRAPDNARGGYGAG